MGDGDLDSQSSETVPQISDESLPSISKPILSKSEEKASQKGLMVSSRPVLPSTSTSSLDHKHWIIQQCLALRPKWYHVSIFTIHFFAIAPSLVLLSFNFRTYFIGNNLAGPVYWSDTSKLQALQIVAKMHEICIVSSLGLVVLDAFQRLLCRGVPLGLVGTPFNFIDGKFLWYVLFPTQVM